MNREFILHSDVEVFSIPDGEKILLKKGMPGIIAQSLGDNFTIVVEGNMYQVKGSDAEAIGEEKKFNTMIKESFDEKDFINNVNNLDLGLPKKIKVAVPANQSCGLIPVKASV